MVQKEYLHLQIMNKSKFTAIQKLSSYPIFTLLLLSTFITTINSSRTSASVSTWESITTHTRTSGPGTEASKDDCRININVYIAFAFQNDYSQEISDQLINSWEYGAEQIWNNGEYHYGPNSCPVNINIVTTKLDQGMNCNPKENNYNGIIPGWHCINVGSRQTGDREVSESNWFPVNNNGNITSTSIATPEKPNGYGTWSLNASSKDVAHAVGHLLGLKDDYIFRDENNDGQVDSYVKLNVDPTQEIKSIMAQTWGNLGPLRDHIVEIVKLWNGDCTEECYCGNGRIDDTQGEQCDFKAKEDNCNDKEICNTQCQCVYDTSTTPECGDGYVHPNYEQCDSKAQPTGCLPDYGCINCQCSKLSPGTVIPVLIGDEDENQSEENIPAKLRALPSILEFSSTQIQKTFTVSNENGEPFTWSIENNFPKWIKSIEPQNPKPDNDSGREVVWVTIDPNTLPPGQTEFIITITSPIGTVEVKLIARS